jgi:hypothetical protein
MTSQIQQARNDGAAASELSIRPIGEFVATVSPTFAMRGQQVQVHLKGLPDRVHEQDFGFIISYTDALGVRREEIVQRRATEKRFVEEGPKIEGE